MQAMLKKKMSLNYTPNGGISKPALPQDCYILTSFNLPFFYVYFPYSGVYLSCNIYFYMQHFSLLIVMY